MSTIQAYFELRDVRPLDGQTWIPLRQATDKTIEPATPTVVSLEEFSGIATAAVELAHRESAAKLGWSNGLGLDSHRVAVESWGYNSADVFRGWDAPLGINLVIDQSLECEGRAVWHLHPDLVVALGLLQEGDRWFRPQEGWAEIVRLERDDEGKPVKIEIRAEHLRDYLSARGMALYCSSYHERVMTSAQRPRLPWCEGSFQEKSGCDTREGIVKNADYPEPKENFWSRGALWRTEWVEPGPISTRARGDTDPHVSTFALDNDGSRVSASALGPQVAWLYFVPTVVSPLLRHRGARLSWYSQETGSLGATSGSVHFGVNDLGLITVFAKDIGRLDPWEQRIWSAHNVTPDGGPSRELVAAQMEVSPASTIAPEMQLPDVLAALDAVFLAKHGQALLRDHEIVPSLFRRAHRFLAAEADGLPELSKELTRLFVERVDVDGILAVAPLGKNEKKPGSLKALERLIAQRLPPADARTTMAPLFAIYDLRLTAAHLGSSDITSALARANVDPSAPPSTQGRQLIGSFVDALAAIASALS